MVVCVFTHITLWFSLNVVNWLSPLKAPPVTLEIEFDFKSRDFKLSSPLKEPLSMLDILLELRSREVQTAKPSNVSAMRL